MLKSVNRLKKDTDFSKVFRSGKKSYNDQLIVFFTPNNLPDPRVGVVVSKKISRKAVGRNRIRRVLLSEISEWIRDEKLPKGIDLVVRVVKYSEGDVASLRESLKKCLGKLS